MTKTPFRHDAILDLPVLSYDAGEEVTIEMINRRDGSRRWVVRRAGCSVLADDLEWEFEPMPSGRDQAFLARTRLETPQDALARLQALRARSGPR